MGSPGRSEPAGPAAEGAALLRRDYEILLTPEELVVVRRVRKALNSLDPHQAIDQVLDQMRRTRTNYEFLSQIARAA